MSAPPATAPRRRPDFTYSAVLRITHWLNVPLLLLMVASGIQILWAYPAFGPHRPNPEALYRAFTGEKEPADERAIVMGPAYRGFVQSVTSRFGIGGWLAGALRWHFAAMWPYTINGLVFLLVLLLTEEGRHYRLGRGDFRGAAEMLEKTMSAMAPLANRMIACVWSSLVAWAQTFFWKKPWTDAIFSGMSWRTQSVKWAPQS